jgi:DNA-binding NarL/FixJ family response regulator
MPIIAILAAESADASALAVLAAGKAQRVERFAAAAALARFLDRHSGDAVLILVQGGDMYELAALIARYRRVRVIVLADADEAAAAIAAGAQAVLPRAASATLVAAAMTVIAADLEVLPPRRSSAAPHQSGDEALAGEAAAPNLTAREREVLQAMADGASNKVIARRLGISFHTAKFHVASILTKLDADTRTEALGRAARLGLVML